MSASPWGSPISLHRPRPWRIGDAILGGDDPLLMGILNVTPDSFFDGGKYTRIDSALRHGEQMISAGAHLVDVGGESSRPGANPVSTDEEIRRVIPVIKSLHREFPETPISIDTVKHRVAAEALAAGAKIVNDISGGQDERMVDVIAPTAASVVLNHMQGTPDSMQTNPQYSDVVSEVVQSLQKSVAKFVHRGMDRSRIAIDPGIGFGKDLVHNYRLISQSHRLDVLGCPILMGMSRKSFIGKTPGLEDSDRLIPSVAAALFSSLKGVSIVRVHDVRETAEALRMVQMIRSEESTEGFD